MEPSGCRKAFGWLSLVIEPVSRETVVLDLSNLARSLKGKTYGDAAQNRTFAFPSQGVTTSKSLLLYDPDYGRSGADVECWRRCLRIERSGALEYCDYDNAARIVTLAPQQKDQPQQEHKAFLYVQIIGIIWTFLAAAKELLSSAGYAGGVRYLVNVIGTRGSVLADFAHAPGKDGQQWRDPFDPGIFGRGDSLSRWKCRDENLQFPFQVVLSSLGDQELRRIIRECGDQFGLAFNHQSDPRCFPIGTEEFPWNEYRPLR